MWRVGRTSCSRYTVPSPNAEAASAEPATSAAGRSSARSTRRIPRPPPPAAALTRSGKPIRPASATMASTRSGRSTRTGSRVPGTTGTPASVARRRAASLSPRAAIDRWSGPTKTRPARSTASANEARSARKP